MVVVNLILVFGGVWLDILSFILGIGWRRSWISMAVGLWLWLNMINPSAGPDSCGQESIYVSIIFGFIFIYIYIEWKRICCSPIWAAAFQGGLESTMSAFRTNIFTQNDLSRCSTPSQKNNLPQLQKPTDLHQNLRLSPATVLIHLVVIQFLPQETSTKVEGLQGRSRPREESFQAAEEMRLSGFGAGCVTSVLSVPWQEAPNKTGYVWKHMTGIPLYLYRNLDELERKWTF